jgi:adenylosuccinate synthase
MSIGDYWTKLIGFYPSKAALRRDNLAYAIQERNVGQTRRGLVLDRIMDLMRNASRASDPEDQRKYREELSATLRNYNRRAAKNRWPLINNRLIGRRLLAERNPTAAQMKTMPKNRRADYFAAATLLKALEQEGLR